MSGDIINILVFLGFVGIFAGFMGITLWLHYRDKRIEREQSEAMILWGAKYGYAAVGVNAPVSLAGSSFNGGKINRGVTGRLAEAGNEFVAVIQTEVRGSGKSRRTYMRTIVGVTIPDTQLQLVINSKINSDDKSGGDLKNFHNEQKVVLEGAFGDYFDVLMPATTQSESLSMLTPDALVYILDNLADYDMEINGNKLFFYSYRHLSVIEIEALLGKVNVALKEMRLRVQDTRTEKATNAVVARTATDAKTTRRRLTKKRVEVYAFLTIGLAFVIQFVPGLEGQIGAIVAFVLLIGWDFIRNARENRLRRKYLEDKTNKL